MKQTTGATAVRWTAKEVVVGKTFWFLILTILLSAVLILGVNSAITYVMNLNRGNSLFVYNYGLGIFSLVLILPAGAFAILLLKLAGNWKLSRLTPEEAAVRHARDVKFKWSPLYCLPIGYGALVLLYLLVSMPLMELLRGSSNPVCAFLIPLVLIFWPLVAVFLAIPAFNRAMIRRTGTNQALVRELWASLHNDQIPQKYQNQRDLTAISMILLKGQVCNVRGAAALYQLQQISQAIDRVCRPVLIVLGVVLLFLTLGLLQFMGREFQNACNNMVLDVRDSLEGVGEAGSSAWEQEQTRKQKWFEASQAEKKPTLTSINPERPPATTPIPTTPTGRPISPMSPVGRPTSSTGKNTGNPGPRVRIKKETRPCPAICRTGPHSVLHTLLSPLQNSQSAL